MLATNGPRWFDRATPDPRWPSFGISLVVTTALFAAALAAMRNITPWRSDTDTALEKPVVVRLTPPAPLPARVPAPSPVTEPRSSPRQTRAVPAPLVAPPTIAPVTTPATNAAPLVVPIAPSSAAPTTSGADSAKGTGAGAGAAGAAATSGVYAHGAKLAPSGVVLGSSFLNTPEGRKAAEKVRDAAFAEMWAKGPSGDIKATLDASQRVADRMSRRATTAGIANDVHVPMGKGMNGVGVDGGPGNGVKMTPNGPMVSVPLPLFYPGPSPAQRHRDSIVNADNVARLGRLGARVKTRADSLRADSLRADSVAKARRRIIP